MQAVVTSQQQLLISNTGGPTAIATTVVNTTCGASNGSITLGAVTGGVAPYTYSVNGSAFTATTRLSDLLPELMQIDVRDANGYLYSQLPLLSQIPGTNS